MAPVIRNLELDKILRAFTAEAIIEKFRQPAKEDKAMPDRRSGSTPEQIALSVQRSAPTAVTASARMFRRNGQAD